MTNEIKGVHRFKPGNKFGKGRPVGATTRAVLLKDYATDEDHACIMRQLIDLAKSGDFPAISLYVSKVCGTPKLPSSINLSYAKKIHTIADMNEVMEQVHFDAITGQMHLDDVAELQKVSEIKNALLKQCNGEELAFIRAKMAEMQNNK